MVFYYTSSNCKIIRNILIEYGSLKETTPNEYISHYVELCPAYIDDSKVNWISETFLSLQKHMNFFRKIALHLSETLAPEEQDYFIIVLQAIIFQLEPVDMKNIFKTLYNLSQDLLTTFTGFLSNNEVLTYISDVAQNYFDSNYITEYIIAPLFKWQPYISEMAHDYALYLKKIEDRRIKPLTVPVVPTVLKRKNKEARKAPSEPTFQTMTQNANSTNNRRMLTKSAIDKKLQVLHVKNKQNATNLLNSSKIHAQSFPRLHKKKKVPFCESSSTERPLPKPKKIVANTSLPPIRENAALIKRMTNRVKISEEEDLKWIEDLMTCSGNCRRVEEMLEEDRQETEKELLYEIERKHILCQISREQAALAKKKVLDRNKKNAEKILATKQMWENAIEKCRKEYLRKSRANVIELSMLEFRIQEAKSCVLDKKKDVAETMKKENKALRDEFLKKKQLELEEKIKMIKEIKALAMIAKRTKVPKVIDLTESSGVGFMCEMSIAELQERLVAMKIQIKEEIDRKKSIIRENNVIAKKDLEDQKEYIKVFLDERTDILKKQKALKKAPVVLSGEKKAKIDDLKKILNKKRAQRLKLVDGAEYAEFANYIK